MKIAIAASGESLGSQVDPHFGRCPYFLIGDSKTEKFEVMENKAGQAARGAGISAAQLIADQEVEVTIAGNFGPNAINVLGATGMKIYRFSGTAKEALKKLKAGELKKISAATAIAGMGMGQGRGREGR